MQPYTIVIHLDNLPSWLPPADVAQDIMWSLSEQDYSQIHCVQVFEGDPKQIKITGATKAPMTWTRPNPEDLEG